VKVTGRFRSQGTAGLSRSRAGNATLRSFYHTAPVMMGVVEVSDDGILYLTDNEPVGPSRIAMPARRPELVNRLARPGSNGAMTRSNSIV
jgi:hypothetical protein